jgi:hypothetical protein
LNQPFAATRSTVAVYSLARPSKSGFDSHAPLPRRKHAERKVGVARYTAYTVSRLNTESCRCELRAGPWGPAGKISGTDTCEWFAGGFHVVCRGEFESTGSSERMTNLEIVSYDAEAKVYTYHGITSFGATVSGKGSVTGNTWTWLWDEKVAGKPARFRETRVEKSPTSHTFVLRCSDWLWTILENTVPGQVAARPH